MQIKIHKTAIETTISKASQHIYEYNFCKHDEHIHAYVIKIIQVMQDHQ